MDGRELHFWAVVHCIHCWAEALKEAEAEVLMMRVERIVDEAEVFGGAEALIH